jgi:Fe2+ or Zn2+ uptake regulation protein
MVYKALAQQLPTLSKTTVYNILSLFLERGIVSSLIIDDENERRYDFNTTPHPHFKCLRCGRVLDLHLPITLCAQEMIEGHRVFECHLHLKGICRECLAATMNP